jgi:hypothetical protein
MYFNAQASFRKVLWKIKSFWQSFVYFKKHRIYKDGDIDTCFMKEKLLISHTYEIEKKLL